MHVTAQDFDQLLREHHALLRAHAGAQVRASAQAQALARLEAECMRLRAAVVRRDTELAWARDDHAALEDSIPGLPKRIALARRVAYLEARIHDLGRAPAPPAPVLDDADGATPEHLEASLAQADLVICQTGCMSHGAYWRVHDHCRRTGKACVLVERPEAVRIVRIHADADDDGTARVTAHPAT